MDQSTWLFLIQEMKGGEKKEKKKKFYASGVAFWSSPGLNIESFYRLTFFSK